MNKDISGLMTGKNGHILHDLSNSDEKIDIYLGIKLKERRVELGYSQMAIAKRIGIPLQQIQKYESGTNSISAKELFLIANIMGVKIPFFFDVFETMKGDQTSNLHDLHHAADDIVNDQLRDAIMGIIDILKRKPDKL